MEKSANPSPAEVGRYITDHSLVNQVVAQCQRTNTVKGKGVGSTQVFYSSIKKEWDNCSLTERAMIIAAFEVMNAHQEKMLQRLEEVEAVVFR